DQLYPHLEVCSDAAEAAGEYLAFLGPGDELEPEALGEVALRLAAQPLDVVYADDDESDSAGRRTNPRFKPDWSPELLLSTMYLGGLLVVRRSLFEDVGGLRPGFEGAQEYD